MFIESVRILKNKPRLLKHHNRRLNSTIAEHYENMAKIDLKSIIQTDHLDKRIEYKCRVVYDQNIVSIDCQPYHRKIISKIKVVYSQKAIDYRYKCVERNDLDELFSLKDTADEIMIVNPDGFITDAFYYNIIFEKDRTLFTPDTKLLKGVMRSHLLSKGKIQEKTIHIDQLYEYEKIHLVNALNPLGMVKVDMERVIL